MTGNIPKPYNSTRYPTRKSENDSFRVYCVTESTQGELHTDNIAKSATLLVSISIKIAILILEFEKGEMTYNRLLLGDVYKFI